MAKIFVTGADGFIGSHLVEKLVRNGHEVVALTLYNSQNSWGWLDYCSKDVRNNVEVVSGDVRDYDFLVSAMQGCEKVMHLAALIAIPYSYRSPRSYVDTNITGTLNVLQASRDIGVERLIHTSTSEVYGSAQYVPIDEDHPLKGQSPYSASKIAADQLAYSFYASYGLPVIILRPFNTYGPRQSARAVIPSVISQIASGKKIIDVGMLETTRDFSFIEDTVSGFIAGLDAKACFGEFINLGTNFEISIRDVIVEISRLMDAQISFKVDQLRMRPTESEVMRLWSQNRKAKELLNWQPKYSGFNGLSIGLSKTISWFSDSENLKSYKVGVYNI